MVWSKTKDGQKNRRRPDPIPRPGDDHEKKGRFKDVESGSVDEVKRKLAMPRKALAGVA